MKHAISFAAFGNTSSLFLAITFASYGYGWYFTLIWVPLYNVFAARASRRG